MYSGSNINIQLSTNYQIDNLEAIEKNLAFVDISDCEYILKSNNIISHNNKINILNINFNKNNLEKNSTSVNLKAIVLDNNGNIIDTSLCKNFYYQYPTYNSLPKQNNYNEIKNKTGGDIYNNKDSMFYDRCISLTLNKSLDIPVIYRREIYDTYIECSNNCTYNGINNYSYIECICKNIIKDEVSTNTLRKSIFDPFVSSNFFLVKCFNNIFKHKLSIVYGWPVFIILTNLWLLLIILYFTAFNKCFLKNNIEHYIYNDSSGLSTYYKYDKSLINANNNINPILDDNKFTTCKSILSTNYIPKIVGGSKEKDYVKRKTKSKSLYISELNNSVSENNKIKCNNKSIIDTNQSKNYEINTIKFNKNNLVNYNYKDFYPKNMKINNLIDNCLSKKSEIQMKGCKLNYHKPLNNIINSKSDCFNLNTLSPKYINPISHLSTKPNLITNSVNINQPEIYSKIKECKSEIDYNNLNSSNTRNINTQKTNKSNIYMRKNSIKSYNNYNIKKEDSSAVDINKLNIYKINYTRYEYINMPLEKQFKLNKISFLKFYYLELKYRHEIFTLFFLRSGVSHFILRLSILFFSITTKILLVTVFYNDEYITEESKLKQKNGDNYINILYTLNNEFWLVFWPAIISFVFKYILRIIISKPKKYLTELNHYICSKNLETIEIG